jgi:hypothetical protein
MKELAEISPESLLKKRDEITFEPDMTGLYVIDGPEDNYPPFHIDHLYLSMTINI